MVGKQLLRWFDLFVSVIFQWAWKEGRPEASAEPDEMPSHIHLDSSKLNYFGISFHQYVK